MHPYGPLPQYRPQTFLIMKFFHALITNRFRFRLVVVMRQEHLLIHCLFFIRAIHKNIEAQIWSEILPKSMKNLKYTYGNLPNESLGQDQEKHFKYVFGVRVGLEFEKIWIKMKNIPASADIYWFFKKRQYKLIFLFLYFHVFMFSSSSV